MAYYKLTQVTEFTDNTCSEDPQYLQRYVDAIRDDCLDNWDKAHVELDCDNQHFEADGEGNSRAGLTPSRTKNLPWLRSTEALPNQHEGVLLFDDSVEHENIQWAHFNEATADYEAYFYVDDNIGGYSVSISPDVWWRRVEGPKDAKHRIPNGENKEN